MEQQPQGGEFHRTIEHPRWPRYLGALALEAWLERVAAIDSQAPSVELFIAQYPGKGEEPAAAPPPDADPLQLPLHLQWGDSSVPTDVCAQPLTPEDAAATHRILATAVSIFAGRTALFALYAQLEQRTYAAMTTRLSTGARLPATAELKRVHGQYVAKGVIEACGAASAGATVRALVARLERRRRHWLGTELRLVDGRPSRYEGAWHSPERFRWTTYASRRPTATARSMKR